MIKIFKINFYILILGLFFILNNPSPITKLNNFIKPNQNFESEDMYNGIRKSATIKEDNKYLLPIPNANNSMKLKKL